MAWRFRKSIKLAPGVRWNITSSGFSWTLGPRGASVSIGKRGVYANTSFLGLYSRERISASPQAPSRAAAHSSVPESTAHRVTVGISDEGTLFYQDAEGNPMPEHIVEAAKKQNRDAIVGLIQQKCDEINEHLAALGRLHVDTPAPRRPKFMQPEFDKDQPARPVLRGVGIMDKLIPGRRDAVEQQNAATAARYEEALDEWRREKREFDKAVEARRELIESRIYTDVDAMENFLEENLVDIAWPRETLVSVDVHRDGTRVELDVDLPEIEHLPRATAAVPSRGLKLSVKELPASRLRRLYSDHVHGIVFRLVGETFAALPTARSVVLSGYSQRPDGATGRVRDDYLLSVAVTRQQWLSIDFGNLAAVDVVEALARFDLRRDMARDGTLRAIERISFEPS
jgi:Protein of unknown function (DUF4236)